ncbi:MAG: ACP S-malonyltransferase [Verrucomicrobiota bacterium]|nr:ACP S-malonyltransferase [Verrucomicrobiota bacterium]
MKRAAVFAGQGAQFVGMGKDLADACPECRDLFRRADEALGRPLSRLCFEGPIEELTRSNNCQPAVFVTSVACHRAFCREAGNPAFAGMAGLSLGEWSALHAAGALSFEDALRILEARGRFMQEACEEREGAMVSVMGLPLPELEAICRNIGVEIANLNSPDQIVLSGERGRIEDAEKKARDAGAKRTVVLKVAGAFHSALMASAGRRLAETLERVEFAAPAAPVMSNVTGQPHGNPREIRENMIRQVTSSVRWGACVESLKALGVGGYVEFGPGRALSGLIKQIDGHAALSNIQDLPTLQKAVETLKATGI